MPPGVSTLVFVIVVQVRTMPPGVSHGSLLLIVQVRIMPPGVSTLVFVIDCTGKDHATGSITWVFVIDCAGKVNATWRIHIGLCYCCTGKDHATWSITWVFVIDCTGMTIQACNPKLGYGVTQVMANHYPERLGLVICVNHNPVFQGIWKAMKVFIHPNTSSKVKLVKSKSKVKQTFLEVFPSELTDWILEEMRQNKIKPLPSTQREFWNKPADTGRHDPRGCLSYVEKYIERSEKENAAIEIEHKAHPNMIDSIKGKVVSLKKSSELEKKSSPFHHVDSCNSDSDEEFEQIEMLDIPDEFKVPDDAVKFT
ncbi:uncharacterized protein LOC134721112 isoform X2 [Mytilus trossulus]|uniref:uncharacterized protein LOC134721112 isoform X2 n=1 Tax=Mytilus trossulus TaxID=6551 RepID=UPI003003AD39